ncbi:hypothetical protein [Maribacter thermophilus]|uniref:hypothetical protein n=1 Tax=Maribacter thermophilus TaxID=1197874 RepID=UPI0006413AF7|nr:hypothetical protein [Maribacter thermophilus]
MNKNHYLFIVFCLLSFGWISAQGDLPTQKPLKIETANKLDNKGTSTTGTVLNIPSVIKEQPKLDMTKGNPVKMLPDEELVPAGTGLKIDPRIGPGERYGGSGQFFGDQYLGDLKSNGKFIGIVCRDHEFVDGDRVKIYVNDVVVEANLLLTGAFKGINVDLQPGFNKIDFEALNHGSSAPNTAQVDVYDDKGELLYSNKWLLSSGSKATLIVTKE